MNVMKAISSACLKKGFDLAYCNLLACLNVEVRVHRKLPCTGRLNWNVICNCSFALLD